MFKGIAKVLLLGSTALSVLSAAHAAVVEQAAFETQVGKDCGNSRECGNELASKNWIMQVAKDDLDGKATTTVYRTATKMVDGPLHMPQPVALVVRCDKDTTDVIVKWPTVIESDVNAGVKVKYRIDDSAITSDTWTRSTSLEAVYVNKPVDLLKKMIAKKELVVQLTPFQGSPVSVTFNLDGLADALKPIREQCKW
jgi:type VI secretion system protein VasI